MPQGRIQPSMLVQFTTLVIYLVFTCSVVYNYAYFLAFNISLVQMPLTIGDIINSALVWVPFVSLVAAFGFLFLLVTRRIEQGMTEEEIAQSTSNPTETTRRRELPFKIAEWGAILAVFLFILLGQQFYNSLISTFTMFMIFWMWLGKKLSDHPRIIERRGVWLRLSIIFVPIIIGFIFAKGYDDAINAISASKTNSVVYLKNGSSFPVLTLRNFERGILLRKFDSNDIKFIQWEEIVAVDTQFEKNYYRGLICIWGKWCPKVSSASKNPSSV